MRAGLVSILAILAVGAATAQESGAVDGLVELTPDEARAELFGVHLYGVLAGSERPWDECIEPDGYTRYSIDGRVKRGRLWIDPEEGACFTYDGATASCFKVYRHGDGYLFAAGLSRYVTVEVRRPVASCLDAEPIA